MKKISLFIIISFSILFLVWGGVYAQTSNSLVPCGKPEESRCELLDIFVLVSRVYNFIVFTIATPLAGILVVIGGVTLIAAAGNPNLASLAKRIIWGAVLGWFLVFGSWLIINTLFLALGLPGYGL